MRSDQLSTLLLLIADAVLALHLLLVIFIVAGLVLVIVGDIRQWRWVRNPWFRWSQLLAIAVVTLQSWFGVVCPLTTLEMALRARAGDLTYSGSFISHWLHALLYYRAPPWVFALAYSLFAGLVVAAWLLVRPEPFKQKRR